MDPLSVLLYFTVIPFATAFSLQPRVLIKREVLKAATVIFEVEGSSTPPDDYKLRFNNIARLYGNADVSLQFLKNAHVCVIGLGGVGSWCVEALSRSGIGKLTLVDMDDICISNTNRQIQAATSTIGQLKGEALKKRILDINPEAQITVALDFMRPNNVDNYIMKGEEEELDEYLSKLGTNLSGLLANNNNDDDSSSSDDVPERKIGMPRFDFVVDAADGVSDKAAIVDACVRTGTPVVVCGGAGGLVDPTLIRITDMSHVTGDSLIMHVRKKLRQRYGYPKGSNMRGNKKPDKKWSIATVHTLPTGSRRGIPADSAAAAAGGFRKCDMAFGNACFTTGTVGFMLASVVINSIGVGNLAPNIPRALGDVGSKRGTTSSEAVRQLPLQRVIDEVTRTHSATTTSDTPGKSSSDKSSPPSCSCGAAGIGTSSSTTSGSVSGNIAAGGDEIAGRAQVLREVISDSEESGLSIDVAVVDCHCHLQLDPLYSEASEAIDAAKAAGVSFSAVCGTCPGEDWQRVETLWRSHPDFIRPQFGLHPWWISRYRDAESGGRARLSAGDISSNTRDRRVLEGGADGGKLLEGAAVATGGVAAGGRSSTIIEKAAGGYGEPISVSSVSVSAAGTTVGIKEEEEEDPKKKKVEEEDIDGGTYHNDNGDKIDVSQPWEAILEQLLVRIPTAGVGECGLDKSIKKDVAMALQEEVVRKHLAVARKLSRPVTLHSVGAWARILEIIRGERAAEISPRISRISAAPDHDNSSFGGLLKQDDSASSITQATSHPNIPGGGRIPAFVLHSANSMSVEMVKDFAAIPGVYFSFTARTLGPKEVRLLRAVPEDRILVETDSPDQLPAILKGKLQRNEMFVVRMSCVKIAEAREMDPVRLANAVVENASKVFDF